MHSLYAAGGAARAAQFNAATAGTAARSEAPRGQRMRVLRISIGDLVRSSDDAASLASLQTVA